MEEGTGERQALVVIGNGMAGFRLCQRLVECGAAPEAISLTVFGEEPRPAYDRVRLTELLAGRREDELGLAPASWYREAGITLRLGDPVVRVDRDEYVVRAASGVAEPFDRLVIATGSRAFIPQVPGARLPGVLPYRTVDDLLRLRAEARGARSAAVIGGGLLGLEAARAVQALGLTVHVVEASRGLLPRQLDETGARLLRQQVEALGLRIHTGARTTRIEAAGKDRVVCLDDGGRLSVDLVVLSAGIRPRDDLAREAGLVVARTGGVVVDDHLATSDPRIFAVGECAAHRGITYGLAAPGYRMIDVLIDNLVGGDAVFEGADRSARLKVPGVSAAALGRYEEAEGTAVHAYLAGGVYRKLLVRDGRIVGALAVGEWPDLARVQDAIEAPRALSFWDLRRFRSTGSLWLQDESPPVYEWPADALVCGCLGVRRGALTLAELSGCETAADLSARTGAGTACGSCRPLLVELVHHERVASMPPSRLEAWTQARRPPGEDAHRAPSPTTLRSSAPPALPALPTLPAPSSAPAAAEATPLASATAPFPEVPFPDAPRSPVFLPASEAADLLAQTASRGEDPTLPSLDVSAFGLGAPSSRRFDAGATSSRRFDTGAPSSRRIDAGTPSSRRIDAGAPSSRRIDAGTPSSRLLDAAVPSSRRGALSALRPVSVPPSLAPGRPSGRLTQPSLTWVGPSGERSRGRLLAVGVAALAAVALLVLAPAVPPSRSFRGLHLDALWTRAGGRQATGYAVLALAVAGLALSARKRWPRFTRGSLDGLRVLHGALGAAALVALALHTGLHAGVRMNRLLTIDFVAGSALGGAAAAAAALGDPTVGAPLRRLATRLHLLLLVPLPVLIALHVLGAYWF